MFNSKIVSKKFLDLKNISHHLKDKYKENSPFPNIVIDNFFEEQFLNKVLEEFPDLSKNKLTQEYQNKDEVKFANNDYKNFPKNIKILIDFMNSNEFIEFLQNITSIKEKLI